MDETDNIASTVYLGGKNIALPQAQLVFVYHYHSGAAEIPAPEGSHTYHRECDQGDDQ